MKTSTPWKPNTSGLPDPFFNTRREYLEKLNELAAQLFPYGYSEHVVIGQGTSMTIRRQQYVDPDTFHPTAGYAIPKSERGQIKDVTG